MNVTMFAPLPPIKAISPYCSHLARELSKRINLQVISFRWIKPEILYSGGSTIEKGTKFRGIGEADVNYIINWFNPLSWIKAALKSKGEIAHIQHWILYSSIYYCYILPILKIRGKKIVVTVHNITPHVKSKYFVFLDKIHNKIIFSFADSFIVHNIRNKEKLMKLYHITEGKISIITHGTLTTELVRNITKKKAREMLNIPEDRKILLFFGYILKYKGLDTLLKSLVRIKKEIPLVTLLIVGQPVKIFDQWKRYEKIMKEHNLNDYVIKKLEYVMDSDVEIYFSASDIVVLPYKEPYDTHGGVPALALSFKKPMVVTDIGGLPEYVKDSRVVSSPDNVDELTRIIINVLKDDKMLIKLSRDSEELSRELCWDVIADKTIEAYKKVCP